VTDRHRLDPDQDQRTDDPPVGSAVVGELSKRADAGNPDGAGVEPVHEVVEARQMQVDQEAAAGPSVGDDGQAGFPPR
jgi:hypothetical protein